TGRTLASKKITRPTQNNVKLKTASISSIKGMNLQLVGADGEYFGPVVLGWKGAKSTTARTVYTRLKESKSSSISLGTISVKKVGATKKQGYAIATKQVSLADKTSKAAVKATRGKPNGVGGYGKSTVSAKSVTSASAGDVVAMDVPQPPNPLQPVQGAPQPNAPVATADDTLGGDKDDDGIPNAFDVDDDGDGILDAADSSTPEPIVSADDGTRDCGSISWRIFTNFKATDENFSNTINAYGQGSRKATNALVAERIKETMTMVFAPITQVCGSNVKKTEIKGNGVSYAPSSFVEVPRTCGNDYQWLIGKGRMCDTGGAGYDFHTEYNFTENDLPSGQDTFTMRVTTESGATYEFTSSPGFVFVTHPMLVSYNTGSGEQTVDYLASTIPRIAITQTTELTLKIFRPQRLAFDGEAPGFYDLGGYKYTPDIPNGVSPGSSGPGKCDSQTQTDSSTSDTLVNESNPPTYELTWNIGRCFTEKGATWAAAPLTVDIQVVPTGPGGNSAQKLFLTLS
ncbi:MAG: hypothetical protein RIR69_1760, partial [Actinomycetota bacterium]